MSDIEIKPHEIARIPGVHVWEAHYEGTDDLMIAMYFAEGVNDYRFQDGGSDVFTALKALGGRLQRAGLLADLLAGVE